MLVARLLLKETQQLRVDAAAGLFGFDPPVLGAMIERRARRRTKACAPCSVEHNEGGRGRARSRCDFRWGVDHPSVGWVRKAIPSRANLSQDDAVRQLRRSVALDHRRNAVLTLALGVWGCVAGDRSGPPKPSPSASAPTMPSGRGAGARTPQEATVSVYHDDTRFQRLVVDAAAAQEAQRAEWRTIHLERDFKKEKRLHAGVATLLASLAPEEKKGLHGWLAANPLADRDQDLVARVTLGDDRALDEVLTLLRGSNTERTRNLVWYLGWFDWTAVPRLYDRREKVLLPLLDHPDSVVVARLAAALERHGRAFWWEPVRRRMLDPKYAHKSSLVGIAKKAASAETVELLRNAMAHRTPGEKADLFLYALDEIARAGGEVGHRAEQALFAAVEADRPEACGAAYYRLFRLDTQRTLPLAEKYLFHVMKQQELAQDVPVSFVLREWARWRGRSHGDLIRSWTSHPKLGRAALEALTELGAGSGDRALIDLWREYAATHKDPYVYHQVAAIGGEPAKAAALELLRQSRGAPGRELGLWWRLNDITLECALHVSVRHGLLPEMPSGEIVRRALSDSDPLGSPFGHWMSVMTLAGRAASFDTETSTFPNRHDELILDELAKASAGRFVPTKAVEVWRETSDAYDVAFEHAGKWYHFRAQGLGDWYDVPAVMAAANRALADAGHAERFHALDAGGQGAFLLLARPESLTAAAAELRLPVGSDPDHARQLGKAFEEQAKKRLGLE